MLPGWARPRQASEEDRPTDGPSAGGRLGQTRAAPHPRCRGSCVPSLPPMAWALSRHACTLLPCVVPWDLLQRLVGWGQPDPQGRPASGGPKPHRPEQESGPSRTGRSGSPAQAPAARASERDPSPSCRRSPAHLAPEPRPSCAGATPILCPSRPRPHPQSFSAEHARACGPQAPATDPSCWACSGGSEFCGKATKARAVCPDPLRLPLHLGAPPIPTLHLGPLLCRSRHGPHMLDHEAWA